MMCFSIRKISLRNWIKCDKVRTIVSKIPHQIIHWFHSMWVNRQKIKHILIIFCVMKMFEDQIGRYDIAIMMNRYRCSLWGAVNTILTSVIRQARDFFFFFLQMDCLLMAQIQDTQIHIYSHDDHFPFHENIGCRCDSRFFDCEIRNRRHLVFLQNNRMFVIVVVHLAPSHGSHKPTQTIAHRSSASAFTYFYFHFICARVYARTAVTVALDHLRIVRII